MALLPLRVARAAGQRRLLPPARFQGNAAPRYPREYRLPATGRGRADLAGSLAASHGGSAARYQPGVPAELGAGPPPPPPAPPSLPGPAPLRSGGAGLMSRPVPVTPRGSSGGRASRGGTRWACSSGRGLQRRRGAGTQAGVGGGRADPPGVAGRVSGASGRSLQRREEQAVGQVPVAGPGRRAAIERVGAGQKALPCPLATDRGRGPPGDRSEGMCVRSTPSPTAQRSCSG